MALVPINNIYAGFDIFVSGSDGTFHAHRNGKEVAIAPNLLELKIKFDKALKEKQRTEAFYICRFSSYSIDTLHEAIITTFLDAETFQARIVYDEYRWQLADLSDIALKTDENILLFNQWVEKEKELIKLIHEMGEIKNKIKTVEYKDLDALQNV